jgi:hypothetical protein
MSSAVSTVCDADRFRHPCGPGGRNTTAARLVQVSASTETTGSLTVTTDDGDKVTLLTRTAASLGYARYDYRGRLDGERTRFSAEALTVTVSQSVSLTVEGELDDAERADVAKLVAALEGAVRKGAVDDPAGTLASLANGGGLESIAGFELVVTRAVNVAIAEAQRAISGPAVPVGHEAPPRSQDAPPQDAAPQAPRARTPAPTADAPARDDDRDGRAVRDVAHALRDAGVPLAKLLRHLRRVLAHVAQRLGLEPIAAPSPSADGAGPA